jgi:hypothetical protein
MSVNDRDPVVSGAVIDDETLRQMLAQEAMQRGRLPDRPADRMWGGAGKGEVCAICSLTISPQDLGYELEFTEQTGRSPAIHFLHVACFTAWVSACRKGKISSNGRPHDEDPFGNAHLTDRKRGPES